MFFTALLTAAVAVSASPVERQAKRAVLSLNHVSNITPGNVTSIKNIVNKGQARVNKINGVQAVGPAPDVGSGSVTNEDVSYVAPVSIGGKTWQLIVDTGCM